jgi:hypothetical protein
MSSSVDARMKKRLRFVTLQLLYEQHDKQRHRHSDVTMTGVLKRMNYDVYVDLVRAILQDLKEREMIDYQHSKDDVTGKFSIFKIEIRPKGRDVVEANEDNALAEI